MAIQNTAEAQGASIATPELTACVEMQMAIGAQLVDLQRQKKEGKPIVWASMLMPKEIFYAMDIPAIQLEVLVGMASMMGLAGTYCQSAEEYGLPRDACATHRCSLGIAFSQSRDPFFESVFAAPDLAIGANFPCMQESKGSYFISDKYNCPHYLIDTPVNTWGEHIPDHAVEYYADQLLGAIHFMERYGYHMDWKRLQEEIAFSKSLGMLLDEIEVLRRAVPAPMAQLDSFILAAAPISMHPSMRKLDVFERARDELKERVERKKGLIENEKLRLLWVGIPPTCDFGLMRYCEQYGAVVTKSTLEFLMGFALSPEILDPEKPLESLARAMLVSPGNPLYQSATDWIVQQTKAYQIDGVVSTVERKCSLVVGMQRLTKDAIERETGVPSIVFDLDGLDERDCDPISTKASLDAFIEMLLATKGA